MARPHPPTSPHFQVVWRTFSPAPSPPLFCVLPSPPLFCVFRGPFLTKNDTFGAFGAQNFLTSVGKEEGQTPPPQSSPPPSSALMHPGTPTNLHPIPATPAATSCLSARVCAHNCACLCVCCVVLGHTIPQGLVCGLLHPPSAAVPQARSGGVQQREYGSAPGAPGKLSPIFPQLSPFFRIFCPSVGDRGDVAIPPTGGPLRWQG